MSLAIALAIGAAWLLILAFVLCLMKANRPQPVRQPVRFAPEAVDEVGQACDGLIFEWPPGRAL